MFSEKSPAFFLTLLGVFLILTFLILKSFAAPIILAILLATLSHRLYEKILKAFRGQKTLAALLMLLIIVLAIILPFFGILTMLTKEGFALFLETKDQLTLDNPAIHSVETFFNGFNINIREIIQEQFTPHLKTLGQFMYERIGGLLTNALSLVLNFLIMLITIFYLLRDGRELGGYLLAIIPMKEKDKVRLYETFRQTGRATILSIFVAAIAQGILGGLGFFVFGLPQAVFWGTMISFVGIFPFIGGYLVYIPAAIYLFLSGEIGSSILFLIYNIFIVSTIDNIIKPKIIGKGTEVHPLFVFLAILGGLKVFGILGILYGPIIAAVLLTLLKVYMEYSEEFRQRSPSL